MAPGDIWNVGLALWPQARVGVHEDGLLTSQTFGGGLCAFEGAAWLVACVLPNSAKTVR